MRDEMKRQIEILIHQPPELTVRLRIAEACEWLRHGAAGRALEVLEELLAEFERTDRTATETEAWHRAMTATEAQAMGLPVTSHANQEKINQQVAAWEAEIKANPPRRVEFKTDVSNALVGRLPCGCPGEMEALCPHKDPDLADHIATGKPPF